MKINTEKVLQSPIVMISGDESALRKEAFETILAAAGIAPDDFDLENINSETNPTEWLASAGTAPFLAPRRAVIVRYLLRADLDDAKGLNWKGLPDTALLILVADEEIGDEDKQRRLKTVRSAWEKLVQAAGGSVVACTVQAKDFKDLIKSESERLGKKITDRAVDTLSEMSASSASRALEELPKLVLYVGDEKTIQEADVRALVVPAREWNVYKMVDAVVDGDVGTALRQLRTLVGSTAKAEDHAFRTILPNMSRSLRLIWQARVCIDAKTTPERAPESVQRAFLPKPNIATEAEFVRNKAMRTARNLSLDQIADMLQIVADCDAGLKGLLPSFSAMETLEQMLLKMADVARPKLAVRT